MKHRKAMADTVSVAPDGTLLSLGGVPLAIPTSPTESNSNFNQSGVVLADPGHSRSGAGGTASRISHSEPDEVLFPQPFLQVLIFLCTIKFLIFSHFIVLEQSSSYFVLILLATAVVLIPLVLIQ